MGSGRPRSRICESVIFGLGPLRCRCSGSPWMRWRSCQRLSPRSSAPPWPRRRRRSHARVTDRNRRKGEAAAPGKAKKTRSGSQRADTSFRTRIALWHTDRSLRARSVALPKPLRLDVVIVRLDGSFAALCARCMTLYSFADVGPCSSGTEFVRSVSSLADRFEDFRKSVAVFLRKARLAACHNE